jgi:trans-aconitate methyltransferase
VRLLDRFPAAAVVGVDADPLLLGLARSAYFDRSGLRIVGRDLRVDDWVTAVGEGGFDAVVSTTALHWLTPTELTAVYALALSCCVPLVC